jgi:hypothetical protein
MNGGPIVSFLVDSLSEGHLVLVDTSRGNGVDVASDVGDGIQVPRTLRPKLSLDIGHVDFIVGPDKSNGSWGILGGTMTISGSDDSLVTQLGSGGVEEDKWTVHPSNSVEWSLIHDHSHPDFVTEFGWHDRCDSTWEEFHRVDSSSGIVQVGTVKDSNSITIVVSSSPPCQVSHSVISNAPNILDSVDIPSIELELSNSVSVHVDSSEDPSIVIVGVDVGSVSIEHENVLSGGTAFFPIVTDVVEVTGFSISQSDIPDVSVSLHIVVVEHPVIANPLSVGPLVVSWGDVTLKDSSSGVHSPSISGSTVTVQQESDSPRAIVHNIESSDASIVLQRMESNIGPTVVEISNSIISNDCWMMVWSPSPLRNGGSHLSVSSVDSSVSSSWSWIGYAQTVSSSSSNRGGDPSLISIGGTSLDTIGVIVPNIPLIGEVKVSLMLNHIHVLKNSFIGIVATPDQVSGTPGTGILVENSNSGVSSVRIDTSICDGSWSMGQHND